VREFLETMVGVVIVVLICAFTGTTIMLIVASSNWAFNPAEYSWTTPVRALVVWVVSLVVLLFCLSAARTNR
jgi:hypothetical protein